MANLHVLFEHAAGYALFRVKEFEEVAAFVSKVEKAALDLVKFKGLVQLVAFQPFKSGTNALENTNNISEGVMHEDLQLFLETNVPKAKKKEKPLLGVSDSKIATAVQENLGYSVQHTGVVPEVLRGIRLHAASLIDGLNVASIGAAELSLGRSYSRAKVKFNVNRVDNMIIQSIALIDQLDKDINTFAMRLREWYGYHFPELVKIVNENYNYARVAQLLGNRKTAIEEGGDELLEKLEEILVDAGRAEAVVGAMKMSMGMDISEIDLINIHTFSTKVIHLAEYRKQLMGYLQNKMKGIAPNLATLVGETVGARLISHAGSLTNLAKYPASTVQILGAEKALFRALKTRGNTPKYGLIFHSTFIGRAESKNKGRISRFLANKCSIASRIDCFSENASDIFGQKLKEQVEDRLKFYTTGAVPKKNIDVMQEALEEVRALPNADAENVNKSGKKKKDKKKKRKAEEDTAVLEEVMNGGDDEPIANGGGGDEPPKKKKKKKKKSRAAADDEDE